MKAEIQPVGLDFTGSTLKMMQGLIDHWGKHPFIVQLARQVAELAGAKNPDDESWAVWAWIRAHVTYRADPVGTQWVQDPYETAVVSKAGNCANMAVLAGSMLQALGHPAVAVAVHWEDRNDWTHAVVMDQKLSRVVDPVSPTYAWPPLQKKVKYLVDADGNLCSGYQEEGRGLGFSIGGWHPFQIKTYLPTLKKLDPLANTSIGKAVWKPIEKIDQTVNKDFAKAKVWSQDHRKQLQIAAAIAATVVTAGVASGAFGAVAGGEAAAGAGAAEAAAGAEAAGEAVTATTFYAPEVLTEIPLTTVTGTGLVPAAAEAAGGSSLLSTVGSGISTAASWGKDALTLLSLEKAFSGNKGQGQAGASTGPVYAPLDPQSFGGSCSFGGGFGSGGGVSGGGPLMLPDAAPVQESTLPRWALPAAGLFVLFLVTR